MKQDESKQKGSLISILVSGIRQIWVLCNNRTSIFGISLFVISFSFVVIYTFAMLTGVVINRYFEGFLFLIIPALFVGGMFFVPIGIFLMHRREIKRGREPSNYEIKVKDPRFRGSVLILIVFSVTIVLPVLAVSSYKVFHFTESTEFCGHICHTVMEPQAAAHARSAHARVPCAECHIGAGADFFVKSKLSGMRQVYAVLADTYPRPIPPAITELRPARDTCEECHWPSKFFGTQYKKAVHYSQNEFNTRREVQFLVKTGGGNASTGQAEGIHMHMLSSGKIEYTAATENLQEIPQVKYTRLNGDVSVYRKQGDDGHAEESVKITRTVDCMDCHNRGAHHLLSPKAAMNNELELKRVDGSLPFVMREALTVLGPNYDTAEEAHREIEKGITGFYEKEFPEVWAKKRGAVDAAVKRIQAVYDDQFFPAMKANWSTYPENVGHQMSKGCFRCHDGLHVDEKGRTINSDCTTCHWFINDSEEGMDCLNLGKFRHPNSLSVHRRVLCSNCHSAGKYRTCEDCHKNEPWEKLRGQGQFRLPPDQDEAMGVEEAAVPNPEDALFKNVDESKLTEWERTEYERQAGAKKKGAADTETTGRDSDD